MKGIARAAITVAIGVALGIIVAQIAARAVVSQSKHQLLSIEHESGRELRIGTAVFDSPFVQFLGADGVVVMEMMTTPTGHALFEIKNPNTGEPAFKIDTATPTGAARILLYNPTTGQAAKTITFDSE